MKLSKLKLDSGDKMALKGLNIEPSGESFVVMIPLTHFILNVPKGKTVIQKNKNKKDFRKSNLVICTESEKVQFKNRKVNKKSSRFKGVYPQSSKTNPWRAAINPKEGRINLGSFPTEELAARAYDKKSLEIYKDFANTNKMQGLY